VTIAPEDGSALAADAPAKPAQAEPATALPIDPAGVASDAADAARARCAAILTAPEAAGRSRLAHHLALETRLPTDEAIAVLKAAPREQFEALGSPRVCRLDGRVPSPNIGSDWAAESADANLGWQVAVQIANAEVRKSAAGAPTHNSLSGIEVVPMPDSGPGDGCSSPSPGPSSSRRAIDE
jgi:hypothetical protein